MLNNTFQQFEKNINIFMGGLFFLVIFLIVLGSSIPPRVVKINLSKTVSPGTQKQIMMSFNRDMDRRSVESNFSIEPSLPGKFSWSGHNFVFSPAQSFPYNTHFELKIKKTAHDPEGNELKKDYLFSFQTPPLQFAYIGTEGEEQSKLMLSNFDGTTRKALTDGSMKIEKFQWCPTNSCLYFMGYKENFYQNHRNELYYLDLHQSQLKQITSDQNFINQSFRLSPDGKTVALSRIKIDATGQYLTPAQIWMASTLDHRFQLFRNGQAGGVNFFFSPDSSNFLYVNRDDNFEISSLQTTDETPQFMGKFTTCYGFHPYQPLIIFNKEKTDGFFVITNELNLYAGDGSSESIPHQGGLFRDTVFTPDGKDLVTIFSGETETFNDKDSLYPLRIFHLYRYNLESKKLEQLTADFDYSEEDPVISPDSQYLLFQRYETFSKDLVIDPAYRNVADSLGSTLSGGQIWRLNLQTKELKQLPVKGTKLTFLN